MTTLCEVLGVSRGTAYRQSTSRSRFYQRREDEVVLGQIQHVIAERASYGHRRVTTLVNHDFGVGYNKKRVRRVMRLHRLQLPTKNRRSGRPHLGRIIREQSNERWCSDSLEIRCWNGDRVQIAFALDCHDREVLSVSQSDGHRGLQNGTGRERICSRRLPPALRALPYHVSFHIFDGDHRKAELSSRA